MVDEQSSCLGIRFDSVRRVTQIRDVARVSVLDRDF